MQRCIRTVSRTGNGDMRKNDPVFVLGFSGELGRGGAGLPGSIEKEVLDARHHCYAYVIETETEIQRFSDDGEPSGTGGLPILQAIRMKELKNVLVVVVRYFGGILLGAPGLVRAYGKAATAGLDDAGVLLRKKCLKTKIHIDYSFYGKIRNYLDTEKFAAGGANFTDIVEIELFLEPTKKEAFEKSINEITGGQAKISFHGTTSVDFDENGNTLS